MKKTLLLALFPLLLQSLIASEPIQNRSGAVGDFTDKLVGGRKEQIMSDWKKGVDTGQTSSKERRKERNQFLKTYIRPDGKLDRERLLRGGE